MIILCLVLLLQESVLFGSDFFKRKESLEKNFTKKETMAKEVVGDKVPIEPISIPCNSDGFPTLDALKNLIRKDFFPSKSMEDIFMEDIIGPTLYFRIIFGKGSFVWFFKCCKVVVKFWDKC